jgi:hypothetical protein
MRIAGVLVTGLVLAGCGSDLSDRMEAACMKDGGMTQAQCSCIADRAEKDLSKDAQAAIIAEMEEDRARVEELSKQMSMQDAASVGTFLMNVTQQCAMGQEPAE